MRGATRPSPLRRKKTFYSPRMLHEVFCDSITTSLHSSKQPSSWEQLTCNKLLLDGFAKRYLLPPIIMTWRKCGEEDGEFSGRVFGMKDNDSD